MNWVNKDKKNILNNLKISFDDSSLSRKDSSFTDGIKENDLNFKIKNLKSFYNSNDKFVIENDCNDDENSTKKLTNGLNLSFLNESYKKLI